MWKIDRIGWGKHQKRGNKKSGESITQTRYNVIHMYRYIFLECFVENNVMKFYFFRW